MAATATKPFFNLLYVILLCLFLQVVREEKLSRVRLLLIFQYLILLKKGLLMSTGNICLIVIAFCISVVAYRE